MAGIFSYAKTLWQDGVTAITAARLNHIEQGISDAADSIKTLGDSVSLQWWGTSVSFNLETAKTFAIVAIGATDVPLKGPFMVWFSSAKPSSTALPDGVTISNDGGMVTVSYRSEVTFVVQKYVC